MFRQIKEKYEPGITSGLLKRPLTYSLMAGLGKRIFTKQNRRAQGLWLDFISRQLKAALNRKGLVVWSNAFFPFEMLYGLGVTPVHPETIAAIAARLGKGRTAINCAESEFYSPDTCAFYRCALGLDIEGLIPPPDVIVAASHLCDAAVKVFHNFSKKYNCDYYLLDVPYHDTPEARSYLAGQVRELAGIIASKQGKNLDEDRMVESINNSNEAREYMLRINEMRRGVPCPFSIEDGLSYVLDMQYFGPGSRAAVDFFRALYEEVAERAAAGKGPVAEEKYRLLWLHYIRPYYPNTIVNFIESMGASVCIGEANHVYWEPMDPGRPYESMAAKILSNPSGGPLERRAGLALQLVREYNIDGVIHFSHWGCRQSCGGEYVIRDMMRKAEIPMLILDGDGADSRNYSKEQTRLRLEAFLEMLEMKK